MTNGWRVGRERGNTYVFSERRLSTGQKLHLGFSLFENEGGYRETIAEPRLVVYRGPRLHRTMWFRKKNGRAVGPGGSEVWGILAEMFPEGERQVVKHAQHEYVKIEAGAASDALLRIYTRFLRPRGYWLMDGLLVTRLR